MKNPAHENADPKTTTPPARMSHPAQAQTSSRAERIQQAFARNRKALQLRPSIGQGTGITKVKLTEGLRCEIQEGPWRLLADSSPNSGGEGAGPDPGMFGRGALGACLAMGYATHAACLGIPVDSIEVEVEADFDARGYYGLAEVVPGYLEVRILVSIQSPAPREAILRLLDEAEARSPYWDVFARAQTLHRQVNLVQEAQA